MTRKNAEVVRAVQVAGASRSGPTVTGKLWLVTKMHNLRLTDDNFLPTDPLYNPDDTAMILIHCRI